jgi:hypothetical protein
MRASLRRSLMYAVLIASIVCLGARHASATSIVLGSRITSSSTTFALPIEITGAEQVSSWQFDLHYDPADVQVNTGCDPFSGDVYCSLLTGPVTEGDFFASGAPFNLLNPGFVDLDPITSAETGHLFGVNGAYGGVPPSPSGNGTLAFVEFTRVGSGDAPIVVTGTAVSDSTVPEPGTLVLLATGTLAPVLRRGLKRAKRH